MVTVKFSDVIQRQSKALGFQIQVDPVFKEAMKAINAEVIKHVGQTTLFSVIYMNKKHDANDTQLKLENNDELLVIPVILGG